MLSFLFATPVEMGYDDMVERKRSTDKDIYYVYTINKRRFRTVASLFEQRNLRITGRATRIWKVTEIGDNDEPLEPNSYKTFKDVWLPETSPSEAKIRADIFSALHDLASDLGALSNKLGGSDLVCKDNAVRLKLRVCVLSRSYSDYFTTVDVDCTGKKRPKALRRARYQPGASLRYLSHPLPLLVYLVPIVLGLYQRHRKRTLSRTSSALSRRQKSLK